MVPILLDFAFNHLIHVFLLSRQDDLLYFQRNLESIRELGMIPLSFVWMAAPAVVERGVFVSLEVSTGCVIPC